MKGSKPPTLYVVLETSLLYTGSASDLVKQEVADLVRANSSHADLRVIFVIPNIVVRERKYQMLKRAIELLSSVQKLERVLGHNLNITEEILKFRIDETVERQIKEHGFQIRALDTSSVDWDDLISRSIDRRPPFDPGEKEKGFRDSVIAETFFQLVKESPTTKKTCRLVLVSNDALLVDAVADRTRDRSNVQIISTLEEVSGLINALVSAAGEEFVKQIQDTAKPFFYSRDSQEGLYYKGNIWPEIQSQFKEKLQKPEKAHRRTNRPSLIGNPRFVKKDRQRVYWASRVTIESTLYTQEPVVRKTPYDPIALAIQNQLLSQPSAGSGVTISGPASRNILSGSQLFQEMQEVAYAKGTLQFDVHWSVSVSPGTMRFSSPRVESIEFVDESFERSNADGS